MARAPAIVNLRDVDLRSVNEFASRVRQRLEQIEAQPTASPADLEQLRRQLAAIEALVRRQTAAAPAPSSASRNLFIQTAEPAGISEPVLWVIPVFDDAGAIVDASLVLRTP